MSPAAEPLSDTPPPVALEIEPLVVLSTVAVVMLEPLMPAPLVVETLTPCTSTPLASVIPTPPAFWMIGFVPPAETRLMLLTVRPFVCPHRLWLASSGRPLVYVPEYRKMVSPDPSESPDPPAPLRPLRVVNGVAERPSFVTLSEVASTYQTRKLSMWTVTVPAEVSDPSVTWYVKVSSW